MPASVNVLPPTSVQRKALTTGVTTFALSTLGCKVNAFESELISEKLTGRSYQRVDAHQPADLFVINTCTVTAEADRQARQQVRKAIRRNPKAWIVVTGCYAQIDPQACAAIPGVDLVVGNSQKLDIPSLLDQLYADELPQIMVKDIDKEISLPDQLVSGFEGRTRAFVQIQQGCDQGCTFCIIHTARGPNRSFAPDSIRRQIKRLVLNGYREIVICGVDIGSYGSDFVEQGTELSDLLQQLVAIEGDFRLRLSSLDPAHITAPLIETMAANKQKICPQLHLSLQSGNTLILKRMKRRANRELIIDRMAALRQAIPELTLSADILVGFPTEEEAHFADTLSIIDQLEIPYPHVFAYSAREGTPAARIPRQVEKPIRKKRAQQAREAGKIVWTRVAKRLVGQHLRVLLEKTPQIAPSGDAEKSLVLQGRAANYFPVKLDISTQSADLSLPEAGDWLDVEITGYSEQSLIARMMA